MSYRFEAEGVASVMKQIQAVGEKADFVASMALYDGAGIMAKEIELQAKKIRTAPFKYAKAGETRLPSPEEKKIVTDSSAMGIAKFRKRLGAVDTSVGYNNSGYAEVDWNHMSSSARTNYKAVPLKGHEANASSFLKTLRNMGGSEKYGISANIGRGAQNLKPIGVIANAINSGTSFMKKQPFMRKAVKSATPKCEAAIVERAASLLNSIIKENESGGKSA